MNNQMSNEQRAQSQSNNNNINFNKTYDQCKPKFIIIFLGFKFIPILLQSSQKLGISYSNSQLISICPRLSADFWFTKNIAGRQLAALRWYSRLADDNQEKWCFQSSQVRVPSTINSFIFWIGQFISALFWLSILLLNLVTLSPFWVFLAIFCCVLIGANFGFFLQCKGDHQKKVNGLTKRFGIQFFELNQQKN